MKKVLFTLVLLSSYFGFSQVQSSDSTKTKKVKVDGYIGFNGNINDNMNLNKKTQQCRFTGVGQFCTRIDFRIQRFR